MSTATTTTTTTTTAPNSYHQYHHQFPHFSIDLNQDHHQQQQLQQYQQAAHFFSGSSTSTTTTTASMVLDHHHHHQLPTTEAASLVLPPSSSSPNSLPYHIFMDVEDPDATPPPPPPPPLSCRHLQPDYSCWGPPPSFHPQPQHHQKGNDIYGDGSAINGVEKMMSGDGDQAVEAKWMMAATTTGATKVRLVSKKNKKLTIKTNTDHGQGRPKKYSSAAAWDPQTVTNNNDTSPSTLQQAGIATDHHRHSSSPLSSSSGGGGGGVVVLRVCADCNTTKTPLWRSGPRGPKSLCNACGIRQRKARRALAAAAAAAAEGASDLAGGAVPAAVPPPPAPPSTTIKLKTGGGQKGKITNKNKLLLGPSTNSHLPFKKRCKFAAAQPRGRKASGTNTTIGTSSHTNGGSNNSNSKNKLCSFEDLAAILMSKSSSAFQRVFPQDEKEAAILLMALSYGLVQS